MAMNREQKRAMQKAGQVDAEGARFASPHAAIEASYKAV